MKNLRRVRWREEKLNLAIEKMRKLSIGFSLTSLLFMFTAFLTISCSANNDKQLKLKEDLTELDRSQNGKFLSSYAPILKKISPSVVNVFSTRTIRTGYSNLNHPFFNDPFFERFFGGRLPQERFRVPKQTQKGLGSGVIITEDGYILTNNHVVEGADEIKVSLGDNTKKYKAEVIGRDAKTDIALIKIDAKNLKVATIADSNKSLVGDIVFAIGNPFGIGKTVTQGIISAKGRDIGIVDYEDFIQTDAAINPGNSGGALMDAQGRLIGINTAILSRSGGNQGVGLAIPINTAKNIVKQLINGGTISRGYLGVAIQDVTEDLKDIMNLSSTKGALVNDVQPDSAAKEAGIESGDVIIKVDGLEVDNVRAIRNIVAAIAPETKVDVVVIRDGKEKTISVKLKAMKGETISASDAGMEGTLLEGIEFSELTDDLIKQFQISKDVKGVVVKDIDPTSFAILAGIEIGDVFVEINRKDIENISDLKEALSEGSKHQILIKFLRNGHARYIALKK